MRAVPTPAVPRRIRARLRFATGKNRQTVGRSVFSGKGKRDVLRRVLAGEELPAARAHSDGSNCCGSPIATPLRNTPMAPNDPSIIVVMGVSGSGKSTIAALLAARLHWIYEDGDWFHPPQNVAKMHAGYPLTDDDRWSWLAAIAAWIDKARATGTHAVIACSALKRSYRNVLIGNRSDVRLVFLKGRRELIAGRLALRHAHFMPASLLDSQFAVLQEPGADEHPIVVPIEEHPRRIVDAIVARLAIPMTQPRGHAETLRGTAP
jgi:gluconokinase